MDDKLIATIICDKSFTDGSCADSRANGQVDNNISQSKGL